MAKKTNKTAEPKVRRPSAARGQIPPTVEGVLDTHSKRSHAGGVSPYGPANERRRAGFGWVSRLKAPQE